MHGGGAAVAPARSAAERPDDQHVRRLAGVPADDVAAVGRRERPGQLDLDEAEQRARWLSYSPAWARLARFGFVTLIEYFEGCVSTVGLSILPSRSMSLIH